MRELAVLPQSRREILQVSHLRAATTTSSSFPTLWMQKSCNEKPSSSFAFPSLADVAIPYTPLQIVCTERTVSFPTCKMGHKSPNRTRG